MYLSFYNLREEPFRLTPDPRFLPLAEPVKRPLRDSQPEVKAPKSGVEILIEAMKQGRATARE